jgi:hypothetical protein
MTNLSKNGIGVVALVIALFGLDVPQEALTGAWEGALAIISLILMIVNQIGRKDVEKFILKK